MEFKAASRPWLRLKGKGYGQARCKALANNFKLCRFGPRWRNNFFKWRSADSVLLLFLKMMWHRTKFYNWFELCVGTVNYTKDTDNSIAGELADFMQSVCAILQHSSKSSSTTKCWTFFFNFWASFSLLNRGSDAIVFWSYFFLQSWSAGLSP